MGYSRHQSYETAAACWSDYVWYGTEANWTKILTSFEETYFATVFMIKISILILYKRLFGIYDTSRRLVYIGIAMVILITIPACGVAIARSVRCDGIEALTRSLCKTQNVSTVLTIFSVCNMVTDLYTLIIPINRILKLHIDLKRKLGVFAIFVGGSAYVTRKRRERRLLIHLAEHA